MKVSRIYFAFIFTILEAWRAAVFFAKDNFVRAAIWKFGGVCGDIWKNTKASKNCYAIYT